MPGGAVAGLPKSMSWIGKYNVNGWGIGGTEGIEGLAPFAKRGSKIYRAGVCAKFRETVARRSVEVNYERPGNGWRRTGNGGMLEIWGHGRQDAAVRGGRIMRRGYRRDGRAGRARNRCYLCPNINTEPGAKWKLLDFWGGEGPRWDGEGTRTWQERVARGAGGERGVGLGRVAVAWFSCGLLCGFPRQKGGSLGWSQACGGNAHMNRSSLMRNGCVAVVRQIL